MREVHIQDLASRRRRASGRHREERVWTVTDTNGVVLEELKEQRFSTEAYQVFHKYYLKNEMENLYKYHGNTHERK